MRTIVALAAAMLLGFALINQADAQSIAKAPDGTVTWQAGIDGATLEFNPDGSVKRIYSKFSHPVTIADKRGIQTATVIAEEKAKASIVRFLKQEVASSRIVNEFENTASKTTQESTAAGDAVSTVDQRAITQSLNQLTSSFAAGTLSGVVVLENGYDDKEREAWVVVGLSQKTMAAAQATQHMMSESQRSPSGAEAITAPSAEQPKGVIRRGNSGF
jgi:hypothetical protein